MQDKNAEDVCSKADIGSLSLNDAFMLLAPPTKQDDSAVHTADSRIQSETSATATTTALLEDLSLAEATTSAQAPPGKTQDSSTELAKCLTFLIDKQIPQAEGYVEQFRPALEGVSTRSMRHRVFYDRSVCAQNELDWLIDAREIIKKAITHGSQMTVDEIGDLGDVKGVLLQRMRNEEAGRC